MRAQNLLFLMTVGLLAACQTATPSPTSPPTLTASPSPTRTALPTKTATPTPSAINTSTPRPTATATFDIASLVTVTPASAAQCPSPQPQVALNLTFKEIMQGDPALAILDFLNAGGEEELLETAIRAIESQLPSADMGLDSRIQSLDLTNDGAPELLVELFSFDHISNFGESYSAYIFTCRESQYHFVPLAFYQSSEGFALITLVDLNQNGITEIVLENLLPDRFLEIKVLEWDGTGFSNLIFGRTAIEQEEGWLEIRDFDADGLQDLVITAGIVNNPDISSIALTRTYLKVWVWNGKAFQFQSQQAEQTPKYRIQAIEDGDLALKSRDYVRALAAYEQAIVDEALGGWNTQWLKIDIYDPNPAPTPTPDEQERPRLEAYAHYRKILIHALQNEVVLANQEYELLQKKFSANPALTPYTQLAQIFFETFITTADIFTGCQAARDFAKQNASSIIALLDVHYYGPARPRLTPEDICPFK